MAHIYVAEEARKSTQRGWRKAAKTLLDRVVALSGLIVFAPLVAGAWIIVWAKMGRPVIFRQRRPGLYGRPFTLWKFRTMLNDRDKNGVILPDHQRLTGLGRFLRATSIDELPQLWNVLRGDLSLVGPRPLLMDYLPRYSPEQARRHEVMPGITGWAQVNGRNAITWDEKFALDVWYADNWSPGLDCKILWMTILKVLGRQDISQRGHATMTEFMGTESRPVPCNSMSAEENGR